MIQLAVHVVRAFITGFNANHLNWVHQPSNIYLSNFRHTQIFGAERRR